MTTHWELGTPSGAGPHGAQANPSTDVEPSDAGAEPPARAPEPGDTGDAHAYDQAAPLRPPSSPWVAKTLLVVADLSAIVLALGVALALRIGAADAPDPGAFRAQVTIGLLVLPVWPLLFVHYRLYAARFVTRGAEEFRRIVLAVGVGFVVLMALAFLFNVNVSRAWVLVAFVLAVLFVSVERLCARAVFRRLRKAGRMRRPVLIVGVNDEGLALARQFQRDPGLGYVVLGFLDDDPTLPDVVEGLPVLGTTDQAVEVAETADAVGVVIATTGVDIDTSNRLIRQLTDASVHVELSSSLRDIAASRLSVRPLGRYQMMYIEPTIRHGWRQAAKRAFDIVVASLSILVTSPIMLAAAILVKLDSRGPVLFRQVRVGRNGETFEVLKFRTMAVDAEERLAELLEQNEAEGPLFKMRDDPRVTRVGRYLRKSSVDELPQLFNVLRDEMSLVGPRPALPREVEQWSPTLRQRLRVKPGITGMWQVHGRSSSSFEEYERLDLFYVDNWSLIRDMEILAKTLPVVLLRRGAY